MKRFLACALALSLGLVTLGCGGGETKKTTPAKGTETKAAAPSTAPAAPTTTEKK